jgi:hypothetical protein
MLLPLLPPMPLLNLTQHSPTPARGRTVLILMLLLSRPLNLMQLILMLLVM